MAMQTDAGQKQNQNKKQKNRVAHTSVEELECKLNNWYLDFRILTNVDDPPTLKKHTSLLT